MSTLADMEGRAFGRLTVIECSGDPAGAKTRWLCQCECGATPVVRGDHLRGGLTRSCGCLSRDIHSRRPRPARAEVACPSCGAKTKQPRHGWCFACYQRWLKAGRPESGPPPLANTAFADWLRLPTPSLERGLTALSIGTAGEHVVCADLLLSGFTAFRTDQNCAYDVAVDLGGRLVRLQVKSTLRARPLPQRSSAIPAYTFAVRRSGVGGRRTYAENAFDLLALVALDIRTVAYLPPSQQRMTISIRPPGTGGAKQFGDFPFAKAAAELEAPA
jgi:hypothetical protein